MAEEAIISIGFNKEVCGLHPFIVVIPDIALGYLSVVFFVMKADDDVVRQYLFVSRDDVEFGHIVICKL